MSWVWVALTNEAFGFCHIRAAQLLDTAAQPRFLVSVLSTIQHYAIKNRYLYTADNALRLTRHDRSICQLHGGPGVTALLQPIEYYSSEWYKDNGDLMKAVDNALACFRQDHENHDNTLKRLIKRRQNRV